MFVRIFIIFACLHLHSSESVFQSCSPGRWVGLNRSFEMAKNEVVAGTQAGLPASFIDEDMLTGGNGFENVSAKDMLIPRLTILQKMSPQIDDSDPKYIKDAKYGDFCDTGTGEIFKEMTVVPCFFAMVCTPLASVNVNTAGNPSGITAIDNPTIAEEAWEEIKKKLI